MIFGLRRFVIQSVFISNADIENPFFPPPETTLLTYSQFDQHLIQMAPYPHLTSGLRHVPTLRPLKEGEIFIIRYKNALRHYTTDVWIGVILPHMFGPTRHTHRRPSGAQPEDGEWGTHLKDRVYSFYLPGRNM